MRTDSPKFPDTYAIASTFSKSPMAESIEVEILWKNLFFKKIHYKKILSFNFLFNFGLSKYLKQNEM